MWKIIWSMDCSPSNLLMRIRTHSWVYQFVWCFESHHKSRGFEVRKKCSRTIQVDRWTVTVRFVLWFCYVSMWHTKSKSTKTIDFVQSISWMEFRVVTWYARTKPTTARCAHCSAHYAYGFNEDVLHYAQWMTKWKHLRTESMRDKTKRREEENIQIRDPVHFLFVLTL